MYELSLLAAKRVEREDRHMADGLEVSPRRVRRWHPISEKLKIVKLSLQPGVSVAEVARSRCEREPVCSRGGGLRAWRTERAERSAVTGDVSNPEDEKREPVAAAPFAGGSIHIELPGRALISVESRADASLLPSILESLGQ